MLHKSNLIYFAILVLVLASSESSQAAALMCGNLSGLKRNVASLSAIPIAIKGEDTRKPQEEFSNPENLVAQQLLGKNEIAQSASGVVAIECYYQKDGKNYRTSFNGVLVCDQRTLLVNSHSFKEPFCDSTPGSEITCVTRPDGNNPDHEFIATPKKNQLMVDDVCAKSYSKPDIAIVKLEEPSKRKPIKIGTVRSFAALLNRPFVSVAANVSHNYRDKNGEKIATDRTFSISQFDGALGSFEGRSDLDIGRGSSGSAQLINQDQELLLIGVPTSMSSNRIDENGLPVDGLPYDPYTNFSSSVFFEKQTQDFIRKHVDQPNKCFKEVRPADEKSA